MNNVKWIFSLFTTLTTLLQHMSALFVMRNSTAALWPSLTANIIGEFPSYKRLMINYVLIKGHY